METELKDIKAEPPNPRAVEMASDGSSNKDDRPLLKSESTLSSTGNIQELEKKYAAYVRNDVYGPMGRRELPLPEKVLLAVALVTFVPVRVVLAIFVLVLYYVICRVCTLFSAPNRNVEEDQEDFAHMGGWRRAVVVTCGRLLSRFMLFLLGFYWIRESYRDIKLPHHNNSPQNEGKDQCEEPEKPGAIVSNHVSYLDILYHMSSSFPSFVAKRSVAKLPLVGLISKCLGCIFVQRESKSSDFKGVSGIVTERIKEAYENRSAPMMMLFPEGTTTNGDYILTFKTGAFLAGVPVLPVILRYPYQRFSLAWDSITGVRHVIFLLCQFINHMEVIHLPVYYPSQEEKDDPKLYANNVRQLMAKEGNLLMSDIGLAEKRIYLAALNGKNSLPTVLHQKDD